MKRAFSHLIRRRFAVQITFPFNWYWQHMRFEVSKPEEVINYTSPQKVKFHLSCYVAAYVGE
jgi:hypothetical protein